MTTQRTTTSRNAEDRLLAGLPVRARRLSPAGIPTRVLEGGDGAPVVLLHGPVASAAHWMHVIPGLAAAHRVIAPDLPGHGASETGDHPLDGERLLAWLDELIAATCESAPTVVGYALGGAIAARFAADRGDRLAHLVLVDALGLTAFHPAPEFGLALDGFLAEPGEDTHDRLWRQCAFDLDDVRARMGARWPAFVAANVVSAGEPAVQAAIGALMAAFGAPAIADDDLARIAVPTTLIWGRHDRATPVSVAEAAAARHGWPLHVIAGAADDPPIERPEDFLRALHTALVTDGRDGRARSLARELAATGFHGDLVGPGDPDFDALRRVYNGMIDRRPALIARCRDARDVAAAVSVARDRGVPLSVYGGGHNVTGNAVCDGGITIDLRLMKRIDVDPDARTCRAEAGLTWGEVDAATQHHGLAVTGGRISTTGIGGLVLGGGSGWIERACGYAVDNLLAVEIVTADGNILTASETENAELFWGTRGGGGNFGVATRFDLRLHPIGPTVLGGILLWPAAMAPAVLRTFRDVMAGAPDAVGSGVALLTAPPEPFVPEGLRGQPAIGMIVCHTGSLEEGEDALQRLRGFGPPAVDLVQPMPYVALQRMLDASYPAGMRNYWTGDFLSGLPEAAIEVLCRLHGTRPSPLTQMLVLPGGGAASRVPDGTMAIGQRDAPFNVHITSLWADVRDDAANVAWTRELSAALKPFTTGRVYVNFIGDEGRERVVASFGEEGYARLQALKRRYDPGNLFRTSQNVEPD
jgi:FAD/FMN-containing dehydrogenase/pimeloyl-ACP methyl ester carboxylesterase